MQHSRPAQLSDKRSRASWNLVNCSQSLVYNIQNHVVSVKNIDIGLVNLFLNDFRENKLVLAFAAVKFDINCWEMHRFEDSEYNPEH